MTGSPDELRARLRAWALETISRAGEYWAYLVQRDEYGHFDTISPLESECVYWFGGEEYVPRSMLTGVSPERA